jgi:hypothetical protein
MESHKLCRGIRVSVIPQQYVSQQYPLHGHLGAPAAKCRPVIYPIYLNSLITLTYILICAPQELVCVGGFVHIIDQVLTIPLTTVFELTAANLEFFTSILNVGGYLNDSNAGYVNGILDVPNVTYFIPNSAEALANATNIIKVNGTSAELEALFEYHIVRDFLGYSPLLTNGTSLKTAQGENITITIQDGQMFVNSAKVIETDLIVANGVVHVLDRYVYLLARLSTGIATY